MKRVVLKYLVVAALLAVFTSCQKDNDAKKQMTMITSKSDEVSIYMAGSGTFTIDWDDGSEIETFTLCEFDDAWWWTSSDMWKYTYSHNYDYSDKSSHTINVTGENITHLLCDEIKLISLDVSKNTSLTYLICFVNQLKKLDVSKNTALTILHCNWNELTSLDVSKNTALEILNCDVNQLSNLDVSKNTALTTLSCVGNHLTNLDVSKNIALDQLYCYMNRLTSLDVSKNVTLTALYCHFNNLTSFSLNALFATLQDNDNVTYYGTGSKYIVIDEVECDRNIAENKGWTFLSID